MKLSPGAAQSTWTTGLRDTKYRDFCHVLTQLHATEIGYFQKDPADISFHMTLSSETEEVVVLLFYH
jgi:hypothetical protein